MEAHWQSEFQFTPRTYSKSLPPLPQNITQTPTQTQPPTVWPVIGTPVDLSQNRLSTTNPFRRQSVAPTATVRQEPTRPVLPPRPQSVPPRGSNTRRPSFLDSSLTPSENPFGLTTQEFERLYPTPKLTFDLEKWTKKRHHIVHELFLTEQTYVRSLQILTSLYHPCIIQLQREEEIPQLQLSNIFKTIRDLLSVNSQLLEDLYERVSKWNGQQKIGDVLVRLAPFLKVYQIYTTEYECAMSVIRETELKSKSFKELMERLRTHPLSTNQNISAFLIQPIQRIPRYVMLLTDLISETPRLHPDHKDLNAALIEVKNAASIINDAIDASDNRATCLKIQHMLGDGIEIVSPHRKFLLEGQALKQCRKGLKEKRFFVFSDMLVYGRETPGIKDKIIRTKVIKPQKVLDTPNEKFGIQIMSTTKSFNIFLDTIEEKENWMLTLNRAIIEEFLKTQTFMPTISDNNNIVFNAQADIVVAPVWVPDYKQTECPLCTAQFTFLFRKHHCRMCGTICCKNCSKHKVFLPQLNGKSNERVCGPCFSKASTKNS